jgi:hypothetical protein
VAAAAALAAARLALLYLAVYLRLEAWRVSSRVRFRVKLAGLPRGLAGELAREYDEAVSGLAVPGPLEAARWVLGGRPRVRLRGGGGFAG